MTCGLLRIDDYLPETVRLRYAQSNTYAADAQPDYFINQLVKCELLNSGGRGRKFESSHPDQFFPLIFMNSRYGIRVGTLNRYGTAWGQWCVHPVVGAPTSPGTAATKA